MRIIAGEFRSRRLETLSGDATRPTLDKVREAVFSSLGGMFNGGNFLDLYAGSGAVGLEALSRGFEHVWFSDMSKQATQVIKKNIQALKVEDRTTVYTCKDTQMIDRLAQEGIVFDAVYLDPPYAKQQNVAILQLLKDKKIIGQESRVIVESLKEDPSFDVDGYECYKEANYGITKIRYYRYIGEE